MKLKGDLDSIGIADLYKTLATEQATGILTVISPMGRKVIGVTEKEIAVVSDSMTERMRLGDLLISRGHITDANLADALKHQRTVEPRSQMGDVLIKLGFIKPEDIQESLLFQIEEDLNDLYAWRGGTVEFDSEISVEDASPDAGGTIQRFDAETHQILKKASERGSEWNHIHLRLTTPYLCFKLSPKGEELSANANPTTQKVLKFLQQGRTLETVVKRSGLGRFAVCKIVMKLLDDAWIYPFPGSELRFLASEHRANNRFSDALYIYRRILDSSSAQEEKPELQRLIDDTLEAIRRAAERGESLEGAETVSYKEAAEKFKRRKRTHRVSLAIFCVASLLIIVTMLYTNYKPQATLVADYEAALRDAGVAVRSDDYQKAIHVWEKLFLSMNDRQSETAKLVQDQLRNLPTQEKSYIEITLQQAEALEQEKKYDDALKLFSKINKQFPDREDSSARIKTALARIEQSRAADTAAGVDVKRTEDILSKFKDAQLLLQQKKYAEARKAFAAFNVLASESMPQRAESNTALKNLDEMEQRAASGLAAGQAELRANHGEKAIDLLEQAAGEWPELPAARTARELQDKLQTRLQKFNEESDAAQKVVAKGHIPEALDVLQRLEREYAQFEIAETLRPSIQELLAAAKALDARIALAQEQFKRGEKPQAIRQFSELVRDNAGFLASRKTELTVKITSYPEGASVKIDGVDVGKTPLERSLRLALPVTIQFTKQGYETKERKLLHLQGIDLTVIQERLARTAVADLILKGEIFAPPCVIENVLYVLHGTTLSALNPQTGQKLWSIDELLDENVTTRPNPITGAPEFVSDKTWWYPRFAPTLLSPGKLILPLRSREVLEVNTADHTRRSMLILPCEPLGRPFLNSESLLQGKPLLSIAGADGKIRTYDLSHPAAPFWERTVEAAGKGLLPAGLAPRSTSTFLTVTQSGRVMGYNSINDTETPVFDLKNPVAPFNSLPDTAAENLIPLVHVDGRVTLLDALARERLWELPVGRPQDEVTSAVADKGGVYVITGKGAVRKYSRDKTTGKPASLFPARELDGPTEIQLCLGKNLYAVTTFGTIYALSTLDGSVLWDYRTDTKATNMCEHNGKLYVATKEGRLLILNAE